MKKLTLLSFSNNIEDVGDKTKSATVTAPPIMNIIHLHQERRQKDLSLQRHRQKIKNESQKSPQSLCGFGG